MAMLLLFNGCRSYQSGSVVHPQLTSIAVGEFENQTVEARLSYLLRRALAEEFITDGSLILKSRGHADAVIQGHLLNVNTVQIAATKARAEDERDAKSDAYQPSIFRMEVQVAYKVLLPDRAEPLLEGQITGSSDFSQLPDLHVARAEAVARAAGNAARQITAAVTEAW